MANSVPAYAIRDNLEKRRFEADLGDRSLAIAEYELIGSKILLTHTEVPPAHEGHGIGSALIRYALRSARERGLQVVPVCPFVTAYIKQHEEEHDLLDPRAAGRLPGSTETPPRRARQNQR